MRHLHRFLSALTATVLLTALGLLAGPACGDEEEAPPQPAPHLPADTNVLHINDGENLSAFTLCSVSQYRDFSSAPVELVLSLVDDAKACGAAARGETIAYTQVDVHLAVHTDKAVGSLPVCDEESVSSYCWRFDKLVFSPHNLENGTQTMLEAETTLFAEDQISYSSFRVLEGLPATDGVVPDALVFALSLEFATGAKFNGYFALTSALVPAAPATPDAPAAQTPAADLESVTP